jgi:hypothetical protein
VALDDPLQLGRGGQGARGRQRAGISGRHRLCAEERCVGRDGPRSRRWNGRGRCGHAVHRQRRERTCQARSGRNVVRHRESDQGARGYPGRARALGRESQVPFQPGSSDPGGIYRGHSGPQALYIATGDGCLLRHRCRCAGGKSNEQGVGREGPSGPGQTGPHARRDCGAGRKTEGPAGRRECGRKGGNHRGSPGARDALGTVGQGARHRFQRGRPGSLNAGRGEKGRGGSRPWKTHRRPRKPSNRTPAR